MPHGGLMITRENIDDAVVKAKLSTTLLSHEKTKRVNRFVFLKITEE